MRWQLNLIKWMVKTLRDAWPSQKLNRSCLMSWWVLSLLTRATVISQIQLSQMSNCDILVDPLYCLFFLFFLRFPFFLPSFFHLLRKKMEKLVVTLKKKWFQPAYGMRSTPWLVKIHNSQSFKLVCIRRQLRDLENCKYGVRD